MHFFKTKKMNVSGKKMLYIDLLTLDEIFTHWNISFQLSHSHDIQLLVLVCVCFFVFFSF